MGKFCGNVGYGDMVESKPGVWTEAITERLAYGDVLKNTKKWSTGDGLNDDLTINNRVSILSDPYANSHIHAMKYVDWMGVLWKITNVEVAFPRLILTIGGIYNGNATRTPTTT